MGIGRDSRHKHYKTGGRSKTSIKKRKYEMGRPATPCKLGVKRIRSVRGRGGNMKYRALRLDAGNYAWGSENVAKKVRILDVVYNATSNELVRTKTLLKNTVVQIDAHPFMQFYLKKYGQDLGKKKKGAAAGDKTEKDEAKVSRHVLFKQKARASRQKLDPELEDGEHVELLDKVLGSMDDEDFEDVFERPTATRQDCDTPPTTNSVVDLSNDEDSVQSPNTAVPEERGHGADGIGPQTEESPVLPASPEDVGAVTETQQTQPPSEDFGVRAYEPKQVENSQPDPPGEAELKVERKTSGMAEEPQPVGKQLEEPGNVPEASKEPPPEDTELGLLEHAIESEPAEVGNQQEPKEDGGPQSPAAEVPELSAPSPPNGSPQDQPKVEEAEEGTSVQAAKTEKSAEEREEVNKREVSTTVDQPVEEAGDQRDEAPADAEHAEEPAQEDERLPVPPPEKDRSRRGFRRNRIPRSGPGPGSFGTSRRLSGHPSTNSGPDAAFIIAPSSFDMATTRSKVGKAQRPNSTGSVDFWSAHGLPSKGQGVPARCPAQCGAALGDALMAYTRKVRLLAPWTDPEVLWEGKAAELLVSSVGAVLQGSVSSEAAVRPGTWPLGRLEGEVPPEALRSLVLAAPERPERGDLPKYDRAALLDIVGEKLTLIQGDGAIVRIQLSGVAWLFAPQQQLLLEDQTISLRCAEGMVFWGGCFRTAFSQEEMLRLASSLELEGNTYKWIRIGRLPSELRPCGGRRSYLSVCFHNGHIHVLRFTVEGETGHVQVQGSHVQGRARDGHAFAVSVKAATLETPMSSVRYLLTPGKPLELLAAARPPKQQAARKQLAYLGLQDDEAIDGDELEGFQIASCRRAGHLVLLAPRVLRETSVKDGD
eukprot:g14936.t1